MHYIEKMSKWPYNKRPGISTLTEKLQKRINDFEALNVFGQVDILLQIQGIFGRIKQADLNKISESQSSGIAKMSLNLSNWKKRYDDVRIIDQSASGLYESISDNLLELL
jgi:CRISPR-associated endonuclease Csn1